MKKLATIFVMLLLALAVQAQAPIFAQLFGGGYWALNFRGQASGGDMVYTLTNSATANQIYGSTCYSVDAWVVQRGFGGNNLGRICDKSSSSPLRGYLFYNNTPGVLSVGIVEGGVTKIVSSTTNLPPVLCHAAFTWTNGASPKLYVNGVEVSYSVTNTCTTPDDDRTVPFCIGNRGIDQVRTWDGLIYSIRVYINVNLTAAQVLALSQAGRKAHNPLGIATSEYLLNEGSGTNTADSVSTMTGYLSGASWQKTQ